MGVSNALLFTACLLGAAVLGGFVGSCCGSKRRDDGGHEARIAELEDRLDTLANHCMDEIKKLKDRAGSYEDKMQGVWEWAGELDERLKEVEFLMGDTPTGGLLGRVGALEDKARKEAADGR